MKRVLRIIVFLCVLLYIPNVKALEKDENIYATLNNNGDVKGIYVVNSYELEEETSVCDYGVYSSVKNLTNTNKFKLNKDQICVKADEGMFYYQGNLEKELPWIINIKYYLDDEEMEASELSGKEGYLEIIIDVKENKSLENDIYENYLLQLTVTLDNNVAKNIIADNSTIANVSNTKQILFTMMPNSEKTFKVSANVEDFYMTGISINAAKFNFDLEMDSIFSMTDKISELESGIASLYNGSNEFNKYLNTYIDGNSELFKGATKLKEGMDLLHDNSSTLKTGTQEMIKAINSINAILNEYNIENNLIKLKEDITKVYDYIINIEGNIDYDFDKEYIDKISSLIEDESFKNDYPDIYDGIVSTINNYELKKQEIINNNSCKELKIKLEEIIENLNNTMLLIQNINKFIELNQGVIAYIDGYETIYKGYNEIYSGLSKFNTYNSEITTASNKFYNGIGTLYKGTYGISNKVNTLTNKFSYLNNPSDIKINSFVSEKNDNVKNIQFAIVTEGIKKVNKETNEQEEIEEKSFFDRLKDLF